MSHLTRQCAQHYRSTRHRLPAGQAKAMGHRARISNRAALDAWDAAEADRERAWLGPDYERACAARLAAVHAAKVAAAPGEPSWAAIDRAIDRAERGLPDAGSHC